MIAISARCDCTGVKARPSGEQDRLIEAFVRPGAVEYYQDAFSRIAVRLWHASSGVRTEGSGSCIG